jgi:hypothetical protein
VLNNVNALALDLDPQWLRRNLLLEFWVQVKQERYGRIVVQASEFYQGILDASSISPCLKEICDT